ncbi:type II secretion system protein [Candidatus Dependentiae bacterium]|nr:type II secretion system protein [Candidatus Dependentiae bacterium]
MEFKKKGFTLVEILVVIAILGILSVFILTTFKLFSKTSEIYYEKSLIISKGNSTIDYIIEKLDRTEKCLSKFKEFTYTGNFLIFKLVEEDSYYDEYGIIYFDIIKQELNYVHIVIDDEEIEITRTEQNIVKNVSQFKVFFNKGVPEKSNYVLFLLELFYQGKDRVIEFGFYSGEYLRNYR